VGPFVVHVGLFFVLVAWWLLSDRLPVTSWLAWSAFVPLHVTSFVLLWRASNVPGHGADTRRGWRLLALAEALMIVANLMGNLSAKVGGFLGFAIIATPALIAYPVTFLALRTFPRATTGTARFGVFSKASSVIVIAALSSWFYVFWLAASQGARDPLSLVNTGAYTVFDLGMIYVVATLAVYAIDDVTSRALRIYSMALVCTAFADLLAAVLDLRGTYGDGAMMDGSYFMVGLLAGLSGEFYRASVASAPTDNEKLRLNVIRVLVVVASVSVVLMIASDLWPLLETPVGFPLLSTMLFTGLILVVQGVSSRDVRNLLSDRMERDARFRSLVHHSSDVILIATEGGTITYASPSVELVLERDPAALVGTSLFALAHSDDGEILRTRVLGGKADGSPPAAQRWRMAAGKGDWRIFESVTADLRSDPLVRGFLLNARNVTVQSALETQLRQAQKMEAVGRLAGGIAHDFNNLLAAIQCNVHLLRDSGEKDPDDDESLAEILEAVTRGAGLTRQLLTFARAGKGSSDPVDVASTVRSLEPMLRRLVTKNAVLRVITDEAPVTSEVDTTQLEQVVVNLALNARDAMPDGGSLTIEARTVERAAEAHLAPVEAPPGRYAMLRVTDTGTGMDEATRARVFEPFFTTKPQGKGTGLGLSTVYAIVRQSRGYLGVESAPGVGSAFTILLPASVKSAAVEAPTEPEAPVEVGSERILVVDDELPLRRALGQYLMRLGYRVENAASGPAALELIARGERFDLVLTDLMMPGMTGRELVRRLETAAPDTRAIFMSGYAEAGVHDEPVPGVPFVQKPFALDDLGQVVREVLDRRTTTAR
jgi:two-component system, cell cycle sensor histidine kinase and response regulator CckA